MGDNTVTVLFKGSTMIRYNLQFFAEGEGEEPSTLEEDLNNSSATLDVSALADLISEKDKQIQELEQSISELKRSNAQLIVKVNAATQPAKAERSFEENLLNMVGYKPRKE